jgi:hypothetical protein
MKENRYIRYSIVFLIPLLFIFSQCFHKSKPADPRGAEYAGAASCLKCHKDMYHNYLHTAHYLTSRPASSATVHGSFNPDSNTVAFNGNIKAVIEKHNDSLYQVSYAGDKLTQKQRFDIVIGSRRAETYLYWKGNQVHQMPISYYVDLHKWANSPSYSADSVNFSRLISTRCFECHASYIQALPDQTGSVAKSDSLDKSTMLLSIDCERCHGPGAEHVNFHTQNPAEKKPMFMARISSLTRARRMDLCAACHSGNLSMMAKSTFTFKPGDTLANYKEGERFHRPQEVPKMDVHGNQAQLLAGSKCFMNSKIECGTCHNVHDNKVKDVSVYSQYCTSCHSEASHNFCKLAAQLGKTINSNCIDCHMPVKTSNAILINGPNNQTTYPFHVRTHLIAIYPEESQKIMAWMKSVKK